MDYAYPVERQDHPTNLLPEDRTLAPREPKPRLTIERVTPNDCQGEYIGLSRGEAERASQEAAARKADDAEPAKGVNPRFAAADAFRQLLSAVHSSMTHAKFGIEYLHDADARGLAEDLAMVRIQAEALIRAVDKFKVPGVRQANVGFVSEGELRAAIDSRWAEINAHRSAA